MFLFLNSACIAQNGFFENPAMWTLDKLEILGIHPHHFTGPDYILITGEEDICPTDEFKLVWHDEFNGTSLDTAKWYRYFPFGTKYGFDNRLGKDDCLFCRTSIDPDNLDNQATQNIFLDENVIVEDGICKLIQKEEDANWYGMDLPYTSGMIWSKQRFYGPTRWEARCKIPHGKGFWPAFWVFGSGKEFDAFEFAGDKPKELHSTIHRYFPDGHKHAKTNKNDDNIDFSDDFHVYAIEQQPFYVAFFLDGEEIYRLSRLNRAFDNITSCKPLPGIYNLDDVFPIGMDQTVQVTAGCGVSVEGGPFTGAPDPSTVFPNQFEIDYIRVYQIEPQPGWGALDDACDSYQITGPKAFCDREDEVELCFDEDLDGEWTMDNTVITQNPSYDLIENETTIIINGQSVDTILIDTVFNYGCIKVSPTVSDGVSNIKYVLDENFCPDIEFKLNIATPDLNPRLSNYNSCTGQISVVLTSFDNEDYSYEVEIFNPQNGGPVIDSKTDDYIILYEDTTDDIAVASFQLVFTITGPCGEEKRYSQILLHKICDDDIIYRLYPNPASSTLKVEILEQNQIGKLDKFLIVNQNSNSLFQYKSNSSFNGILEINVSTLSTGIYKTLAISKDGRVSEQTLFIE